MPAKIGNVSKEFITNVALPENTKSYTVISHEFVINTVKEELDNYGFTIVDEMYRAIPDGNIATGLLTLSYKEDPELNLAFAWTNSYNKQVRFKACVGAISNVNNAFMILGEQGSWIRKHTGSADIESKEQIINQIKNAKSFYEQLLLDKQKMKKIILSKRQQSQLLGICYADYSILETTTASMVKQQMIKPPFFYSGGSDTLWAFYNHLIYAIQDNHPKTWLEEQRMIHYIITNEYELNVPEIIVSETPVLAEEVVIENETIETELEIENVVEDIVENVEAIEEDLVETEETISENIDLFTENEIATEEEVCEQLYGVNNDIEVIEPSISEEELEEPEEVILETTEPVSEINIEEEIEEIISSDNKTEDFEFEEDTVDAEDEDDDYFSFL